MPQASNQCFELTAEEVRTALPGYGIVENHGREQAQRPAAAQARIVSATGACGL